MPDRTRPIRKEICLNEQELSVVRHKMNQLGTRNFGAYARKMLIDGYIIKVDYTEQKKLAAAVSRIATNINHVCRRINSTGRCTENDGLPFGAGFRARRCCPATRRANGWARFWRNTLRRWARRNPL